MTEATGPNASTSCTAGAVASANFSSIGSTNAPSAATPAGASVVPMTSSPPASCSLRTWRSTSSRWPVEASGPIVVPSWRGSPTTTRSASRSRTASTSASTDAAGTIARRMAVHFCPAFEVISVTSCLT